MRSVDTSSLRATTMWIVCDGNTRNSTHGVVIPESDRKA
jgi:hypothetical protein